MIFSHVNILYNTLKKIVIDKYKTFLNNDIDYSQLKEYMKTPPFLEIVNPMKLKQDIENEKDKKNNENLEKEKDINSDKKDDESDNEEPHYYKILKKLNNNNSIYLFHAYWIKLYESLQLPYREYFKLCEELRDKRKKLAQHIKKGPNKSFKPSSNLTFKKKDNDDFFNSVQDESIDLVYENKLKFMKNDIKQCDYLLFRLEREMTEKQEKLDNWKKQIVDEWDKVLYDDNKGCLLPFRGIQLSITSFKTLEWLRNEKVIVRYNQYFDIFNSMLSIVKNILLELFLGTFLFRLWSSNMSTIFLPSGIFIWTAMCYFIHKHQTHLKNLYLRTDTIVILTSVYCLTGSFTSLLKWSMCTQLMLFLNYLRKTLTFNNILPTNRSNTTQEVNKALEDFQKKLEAQIKDKEKTSLSSNLESLASSYANQTIESATQNVIHLSKKKD